MLKKIDCVNPKRMMAIDLFNLGKARGERLIGLFQNRLGLFL